MVYDAQVRTEGATAREVVGVIETLRIDFSREPTPGGRAFVPFHTKSNAGALMWRGTDRPGIVQSLRDSLRELEPRARVKVAPVAPFERRFGEPRLLARVIGVIGLLALVLTVTGVYSVTSHATSGRTAEIGVRVALGANALRVRAMIVREALWPAAIGILVGVVAAFWWAIRLNGLLFEIAPRSPWVFAAASAIVTAVVTFASGIPATRASRLNPVEALRAE
jgi:ABC-type antimicrobial peptide transport system permease subunit